MWNHRAALRAAMHVAKVGISGTLLASLVSCVDPVRPPDTTGHVVFWTDQAFLVPIAVQLGAEPIEVITTPLSSRPSCGQSGMANYTVQAGAYTVLAATADSYRWSDNVSVRAGECLSVRLYINASRALMMDPAVVE